MRNDEHLDQVALFQWANLASVKYPELQFLYAVPNGARVSPGTARKLKAEGMKAGVFDISLDIPKGDYHGFRGELKRIGPPKGRLSDVQKYWLTCYQEHGYYAFVAWGWESMRDELIKYLEQK